MSLHVVRAGLQSIVVDRGRPGFRSIGVSLGGALDRAAHDLANSVCQNDPSRATIEIAYGGFSARFTNPTTFALTGADCEAMLDGLPVAPDEPHDAATGAELVLGSPTRSVRTYLAVRGGFDVEVVLGSRSTDLRAAFGGFGGRALRAGDVVPICDNADAISGFVSSTVRGHTDEVDVYAIARNAPDAFWQRSWRVSHESNRMGCRLLGEPITRGAEVNSHAVFPGVVQLPPNGEPIVLLADAQTTGGYESIAVVIPADVNKFAQVSAGTLVRFRERTP